MFEEKDFSALANMMVSSPAQRYRERAADASWTVMWVAEYMQSLRVDRVCQPGLRR